MTLITNKSVLLVICIAFIGALTTTAKEVASQPTRPIFIFGDSTLDAGTNNHIQNCSARADHPYYGIDYPGGVATGRFSNGINSADAIVQLLGGYDLSPLPFLALVNDSSNFTGDILHGVNFASGGAGLLKETGKTIYGQVIYMEEQIQQFATVQGNITALLGGSEADLLLEGSMYIISVGSNDIMEYFFNPIVPPEVLIANLTATYAIHLKNLYNLGARKFGILSVPAIGCCPMARSFSLTGDCNETANNLAVASYAAFESLLKNMSSTLDGFKYSFGNTYNMTMSIISEPIVFKDVKSACCVDKTQKGFNNCSEGVDLCPNRDDYLFWDLFHPSQKAAILAAQELVSSEDPDLVTPINFGCLRKA
ncbi:GDSL esterase/lipase-like protein [Tanacetum coccineum]